MKETLIIRNFGPIKNVELELGRFNVLIGDQGTGKSTCVKLLLAIVNVNFREVFNAPKFEENSDDTNQFLAHLNLFGIFSYLKKETYLFFKNDKIEFEYRNNEVIKISRVMLSLDKNENTFRTNNPNVSVEEYRLFDFTYIPSERILISTLSNSLFGLLENKINLPDLITRFGNKFQSTRTKKEAFDYLDFIGVKYKIKHGIDYLELENGQEIQLNTSSNGMQSIVSLLNVFDDVTNNDNKGNLIVIEEPELNCFPATQKKLIYHFCRKQIESNSKIILTTHSPYILTSLNNLMYAYTVGQNHKEEVNKIIEEKYWINPNDVSAYQLLSDGTAKNIIADDGLIMAENIDAVSREINEEYDLIQDIKIDFQNQAS